ncbi:uncharacterized protein LOC104584223 [Brachypodium distachyon]|uniref:uncharacterized protein LOC104584223 n=1 Tax=Brachypodium distachyon TaxID=15368 RepID=UPI00052FF357|nr:uncharacterized protein LOC104584223 [Brachypodium distachyon]|eukprot:XP_010236711.1 uncharacterized protein LOC104584223 [Brachypodium distachyon]
MVSQSSCGSVAKRLHDVIREHISAPKKIIIEGTGFGDCLRISAVTIPNELTEWIVMNIDHKLREFRVCNKSIVFTRDMVKKVFNVPSGVRPVELLKRGHSKLCKIYSVAGRAPIARAIEILKSAPDEDDIIVSRTFVLLALATVLCPSTRDTLILEYLASLTNMADVQEFAWDEHILETVMDKVGKFQEKRRLKSQQDMSFDNFWIGSCFPMLAIIYMDHLDFPPPHPGDYNINYSLPRACFVSTIDFNFVVSVDANMFVSNKKVFGKKTPVVQPPVPIKAPSATGQGDVIAVVAAPSPFHIADVGSSQAVAHDVGQAQHHASQVTSENETNQDVVLQTPTSLDDLL